WRRGRAPRSRGAGRRRRGDRPALGRRTVIPARDSVAHMPDMPEMSALDLTDVERILVVTAHPDDVDFGFAGSVAQFTDAGIEVTYCIVTDGDAGGAETGLPREEMAPRRREEQTAAAAVVGVHDLRFLGYPDGRVEATLDL